MLHGHRIPGFPPLPPPMTPMPDVRIDPPMVYVAPAWEYHEITRESEGAALPIEELNSLGADGWELVAVVPEGVRLHYYFKRLR
jgi:hypothetical protein